MFSFLMKHGLGPRCCAACSPCPPDGIRGHLGPRHPAHRRGSWPAVRSCWRCCTCSRSPALSPPRWHLALPPLPLLSASVLPSRRSSRCGTTCPASWAPRPSSSTWAPTRATTPPWTPQCPTCSPRPPSASATPRSTHWCGGWTPASRSSPACPRCRCRTPSSAPGGSSRKVRRHPLSPLPGGRPAALASRGWPDAAGVGVYGGVNVFGPCGSPSEGTDALSPHTVSVTGG